MSQLSDAFVGIGGNMDDPVAAFRKALKRLQLTSNVDVVAVSSLYRTRPVGYQQQADFTNAVAGIRTSLTPLDLLDTLLDIETQLGRTRDGVRFGPRVIDLDLLLYDDRQIQSTRLTIPHPRMHQRRFALEPLAEIAPHTVLPGLGRVDDLLDGIDDDGVEKLQRDWFQSESAEVSYADAAESSVTKI